jgi:transcriptional regulator with XRE-family HTH domain
MAQRTVVLTSEHASRLRELRTSWGRSGLSQLQLAERTGLHVNTVKRWESITEPISVLYENVSRVAGVLGVKESDFMAASPRAGVDPKAHVRKPRHIVVLDTEAARRVGDHVFGAVYGAGSEGVLVDCRKVEPILDEAFIDELGAAKGVIFVEPVSEHLRERLAVLYGIVHATGIATASVAPFSPVLEEKRAFLARAAICLADHQGCLSLVQWISNGEVDVDVIQEVATGLLRGIQSCDTAPLLTSISASEWTADIYRMVAMRGLTDGERTVLAHAHSSKIQAFVRATAAQPDIAAELLEEVDDTIRAKHVFMAIARDYPQHAETLLDPISNSAAELKNACLHVIKSCPQHSHLVRRALPLFDNDSALARTIVGISRAARLGALHADYTSLLGLAVERVREPWVAVRLYEQFVDQGGIAPSIIERLREVAHRDPSTHTFLAGTMSRFDLVPEGRTG